MLSMSQRAPGYLFQNQVPPTPLPASNARTDNPCPRSWCNAYKPAKPAPTTMASYSGVTSISCSADKYCADKSGPFVAAQDTGTAAAVLSRPDHPVRVIGPARQDPARACALGTNPGRPCPARPTLDEPS